jgi:hypothetical protein
MYEPFSATASYFQIFLTNLSRLAILQRKLGFVGVGIVVMMKPLRVFGLPGTDDDPRHQCVFDRFQWA